MRNDVLEWKINPTAIKQILYIINNIDIRHWEYIGYSSLRNTGVYSWDETIYGEYHIRLAEKSDVSDDERIVFSDLCITILFDTISNSCSSINISFIITDKITKEYKSKRFNNPDDFIKYYNNITKNKGDI